MKRINTHAYPVLVGLALVILLPTPVRARMSAPARPVESYRNSGAVGLSYGEFNQRDASFWGWSVEYSRTISRRWISAAGVTWDREREQDMTGSILESDTYTIVGTISYSLSPHWVISTGLGKGFADNDNPSRSMKFTNGDVGTGIVLGLSTTGLRHFTRDSIGFSLAYEYNLTKKDTSISFDVTFGWSF